MFFALLFSQACMYYAPALPPEKETRDFESKIARVKPGMDESDFLQMFQFLKDRKTRKIGIIDTEQHSAGAHGGRAYWVGYWYTYTKRMMKRLVKISCVNGQVVDVYWPASISPP